MEKKLKLSIEKIYEKDFSIDYKGYNAKEVDQFLDLVMEDYKTISEVIEQYETQNKAIQLANAKMRRKLDEVETKLEIEKSKNLDINEIYQEKASIELVKKIAQLEKELFEAKKKKEEK